MMPHRRKHVCACVDPKAVQTLLARREVPSREVPRSAGVVEAQIVGGRLFQPARLELAVTYDVRFSSPQWGVVSPVAVRHSYDLVVVNRFRYADDGPGHACRRRCRQPRALSLWYGTPQLRSGKRSVIAASGISGSVFCSSWPCPSAAGRCRSHSPGR